MDELAPDPLLAVKRLLFALEHPESLDAAKAYARQVVGELSPYSAARLGWLEPE